MNIGGLENGSIDIDQIVLLEKFRGETFVLVICTQAFSSGTTRVVESENRTLEVLGGVVLMV